MPAPNLPVAVACFDESGKFKNTEVVTVGGCVAMPQDLRALTQKWADRLSDDKIPYTSMKDAVHFHGSFVGWNDGRRDTLLLDLAQMIINAPMFRVYTTIRTSDFKAFPQAQREKLGNDPHYASLEGCIRGALHRDKILLQVICDLSDEYSAECLKLYLKILKKNREAKSMCVGISFQDDEFHPGIQMADMVAYCMRAEATREKISPHPIVDRIITLLKSQDRQEGTMLYQIQGNGLGEAELQLGPVKNDKPSHE